MKKTLFIAIAIGFITAAPVWAQNMMGSNEMPSGMMTEGQQQNSPVPSQEYLRQWQSQMMNNAYAMMGGGYNNMMGGSYGMMPMMGGFDMMPMMGGGYGMAPSLGGGHYPMMGPFGTMPMMNGFGMMYGQKTDNFKEYESFIKETREQRKKLHDLMFEYGEARWNPDTTVGKLHQMTEEMSKLRREIQEKMPR